MNRRQFVKVGFAAATAELISACSQSSSLTSPTPQTGSVPLPNAPSLIPARPFLPEKGGSPIFSLSSRVDGYLYQALNDFGILIDSRRMSSRDTENLNTPFSGNLIVRMLINGNWVEPVNGFDFNINGKEYYDPMSNGQSIIADYYQLQVKRGDSIAITLPPKWNG